MLREDTKNTTKLKLDKLNYINFLKKISVSKVSYQWSEKETHRMGE